jgi:hypothetical protein
VASSRVSTTASAPRPTRGSPAGLERAYSRCVRAAARHLGQPMSPGVAVAPTIGTVRARHDAGAACRRRWLPCPPPHPLGHRASPHHVCPVDSRGAGAEFGAVLLPVPQRNDNGHDSVGGYAEAGGRRATRTISSCAQDVVEQVDVLRQVAGTEEQFADAIPRGDADAFGGVRIGLEGADLRSEGR